MTKALRKVFDFVLLIGAALALLYIIAASFGFTQAGAESDGPQVLSFQNEKMQVRGF